MVCVFVCTRRCCFHREREQGSAQRKGKREEFVLTSQLFHCPHTHSHMFDTIKTMRMLQSEKQTSDERLAAR